MRWGWLGWDQSLHHNDPLAEVIELDQRNDAWRGKRTCHAGRVLVELAVGEDLRTPE